MTTIEHSPQNSLTLSPVWKSYRKGSLKDFIEPVSRQFVKHAFVFSISVTAGSPKRYCCCYVRDYKYQTWLPQRRVPWKPVQPRSNTFAAKGWSIPGQRKREKQTTSHTFPEIQQRNQTLQVLFGWFSCNKWRFADTDFIENPRLYYDGQFYVGEKKFDQLSGMTKQQTECKSDLISWLLFLDLVTDGLITMYLELKAGEYIHLMCRAASYEQSPYFTLNERKRRTLSLGRDRPNLVQPVPLDIPYDKAHAFRIQNFKGLHWCDFCGNFMWGLIAQGVRCDGNLNNSFHSSSINVNYIAQLSKDCGVIAHRKCSEKIPADCCPDLKLLRGAFGVDLTTLNKAHGTRLPFLVDMCIKEIERRGLHSEGIYRVSGLRDDVEALRLAFDKGDTLLKLKNDPTHFYLASLFLTSFQSLHL